jgi:hypothetical protein
MTINNELLCNSTIYACNILCAFISFLTGSSTNSSLVRSVSRIYNAVDDRRLRKYQLKES